MLPADKVGSTEGNIFTELDWGRIIFAIANENLRSILIGITVKRLCSFTELFKCF